MVSGSTVRARHVGKDITALFKNLVGGEVSEYTSLLAQSREQALQRMKDVAVEKRARIDNAVKNNSKIIKSSRDRQILSYLESLMIKKHKPKINVGIKAAKELLLF